jgi:SAM-dependent methyltransferase
VSRAHLARLYAAGDDPWGFRTSGYEQAKFRATRAALPRRRYRAALEVGCGNGELARHLAPACGTYTGIDAVPAALDAARRAVPSARFEHVFLPAPLPDAPYDLIVLSEILYFLDAPAIDDLARQIDGRWPAADIVCVTWLGDTGNPLGGAEALGLFFAASQRRFRPAGAAARYRIDLSHGAA